MMVKGDIIAAWDDMQRERGGYLGYELRFLGQDALPDLMRLEDLIGQALPSPEIYPPHDVAFFRTAFTLSRAVLGIVAGNELIGYSVIKLPGASRENLGRDIGLPEVELCSVAHLQSIAVHPAHRGRGLQRRMIAAHLQAMEDLGCENVCCTVSPKNPASLRNFFCSGLVIRALRLKFTGWWRYIMHMTVRKTIPSPPFMGNPGGMETIWIRSSDIEGQMDLLRSGFVGISISLHQEGVEICYAKV